MRTQYGSSVKDLEKDGQNHGQDKELAIEMLRIYNRPRGSRRTVRRRTNNLRTSANSIRQLCMLSGQNWLSLIFSHIQGVH